MKKFNFFKITCILLSLTIAIFLVGCGGQEAASEETAASQTADEAGTQTEEALTLTLDELSAFNGKDGQPAYIAIDGVIYDVTDLAQWSDGEHNGFEAGNDLTEEIKNVSPHGVSKLKGLPVVGELVE